MGAIDFAWECIWWVAMNGEISQWNSKGSFEITFMETQLEFLEKCAAASHIFSWFYLLLSGTHTNCDPEVLHAGF